MKSIQYTKQSQIDEIINRSTICFIAMSKLSGEPYVIPMNFVYDKGILYLHSAPCGTHMDILAENNKVCVCFCQPGDLVYQSEQVACSHSMRSDSALISGEVTFVETPEEKIEIFDLLMKRFAPDREFKYSAPSVAHTKVWKIVPQSITARGVGLTFDEYKKLL